MTTPTTFLQLISKPLGVSARESMQLMQQSLDALAHAAKAATSNFKILKVALTRNRAITTHGPLNLAADGTWQTDVCASWLHASCPAIDYCDCTCHGGTVR